MTDLLPSPVLNLTVQATKRKPEKSCPSHARHAFDFPWEETGLPSFPEHDE